MNASINAVAKRYRYTGKERDEESGLYYHCAQYYIPWLCRWSASDPINSENYNLQKGYGLEKNKERQLLELTASSYEYCYDNPVRFNDPLGEQVPTLNWDYFNKRHMLSGNFAVNTPSGGTNSIITNPEWQNKATIEKFFNEAMELAKKTGKIETNVTLKNGTSWNIHTKTGHFFPTGGNGITNLTNIEVAILRAAKSGGTKGEAIFANIAKNKSLTGTFSEGMQTAIHSLAKIEGVSEGTVLKHIGGRFPTASVSVSQSTAASKQFGSAAKFIKYGGRALLIVGIASDLYEVYNSENKQRTITKKVGGWAAASAGAYGGGLAGAWFAGWGAIPGAIIGGVGGYIIGETVTEIVYDWIFTKIK